MRADGRALSSVGQSGRLIIFWSQVQVLQGPPYSTIRFLRGGQRGKRRDSMERRGVFHPQGGLPLGHLKNERGRASLGPKRGGDLCGIGGRIEGRPFRKGLWNGICARPDLRGACGKAAAPALGLGSTGRQTGAGQIRWGSTPDGRRKAAVVAACRPTSRPLALVPRTRPRAGRPRRVIFQLFSRTRLDSFPPPAVILSHKSRLYD